MEMTMKERYAAALRVCKQNNLMGEQEMRRLMSTDPKRLAAEVIARAEAWQRKKFAEMEADPYYQSLSEEDKEMYRIIHDETRTIRRPRTEKKN